MPQFFAPPEVLRQSPVILRGADARHIHAVLRLQVGDWLVLCDGEGHRYRAEITRIRPLHVELRIVHELPAPRIPVAITLAAAVIRPERFAWLIEKAFELGCRRLIPLMTERTVQKYLPKRTRETLTRWRTIAEAAAKQSGLPWRPEVTEPTPLHNVLRSAVGTLYYCWEGMAADVGERVPPTGTVPPGVRLKSDSWRGTILIGPEGGFTPAEHTAIMALQPQPLPLGPLILRTETAAATALTIVQQAYGYFESS